MSPRVRILSLALSILVVLAFSLTACECENTPPVAKHPGGEPIYIGFMICNSPAETEARFGPFTEYMSQKLHKNFVAVNIDTTDFADHVKDGELTFTHTNSLLYVILNKNYGVKCLTGDMQGSLGHRTTGGIVVRKDSDINSIKDLKGKTMVFGPMLAPTGYLAEYDLMLKNGFDPETGLAFYTIPRGSFKHEKLIYALMYGAFDAASVPMLDFEKMDKEGKINADDFRVVAQSEPIPYCTFGYTEKADDKLVKEFKDALTEITPDTTVEFKGERVKVLKAAMLDGFAPVKDEEYDSIREMAKRCNMPPYQKF